MAVPYSRSLYCQDVERNPTGRPDADSGYSSCAINKMQNREFTEPKRSQLTVVTSLCGGTDGVVSVGNAASNNDAGVNGFVMNSFTVAASTDFDTGATLPQFILSTLAGATTIRLPVVGVEVGRRVFISSWRQDQNIVVGTITGTAIEGNVTAIARTAKMADIRIGSLMNTQTVSMVGNGTDFNNCVECVFVELREDGVAPDARGSNGTRAWVVCGP